MKLKDKGVVSTTVLLLSTLFVTELIILSQTYLSFKNELTYRSKAASSNYCSGGYPPEYCSPLNGKEYICGENGLWVEDTESRCPNNAIVCMGSGGKNGAKNSSNGNSYSCCPGLVPNSNGTCVVKQLLTPLPTFKPFSTPTLIPTPTEVVFLTSTPGPTIMQTPTLFLTSTPIPTPASWHISTPTYSPTSTPIPTFTPVPTLRPTSTPIPTFTPTPVLSGTVRFMNQTQGSESKKSNINIDEVVQKNISFLSNDLRDGRLAHSVCCAYIVLPQSGYKDVVSTITALNLGNIRVLRNNAFFGFMDGHGFWGMTYEDLPAANAYDRPNAQFWRGDIFKRDGLYGLLPSVVVHESVHNLQSSVDGDLAVHVHGGRLDGGDPTTIKGKVYQSLIEGMAEYVALDKTGHYASGRSYDKYRNFFTEVKNYFEKGNKAAIFYGVAEGNYNGLDGLIDECGGVGKVEGLLRENGWSF